MDFTKDYTTDKKKLADKLKEPSEQTEQKKEVIDEKDYLFAQLLNDISNKLNILMRRL